MSKCLEVLTGGRSMPGKCLRDVALGQLAGCEMGLTLESEEGEVPHLRWSQAPPLPWPRPGSADISKGKSYNISKLTIISYKKLVNCPPLGSARQKRPRSGCHLKVFKARSPRTFHDMSWRRGLVKCLVDGLYSMMLVILNGYMMVNHWLNITSDQWVIWYYDYLVGGLEHFIFFHILGTIIPLDEYFQRGWNHQPACCYVVFNVWLCLAIKTIPEAKV